MSGRSGGRPVALVTGATRGLGRAIADALSPDHHVLVGGRSAQTTSAVAAELPSAAPFTADLTDAAAVDAAVRDVVAPLGRLDVLVHNAGVASQGGVGQTSHAEWRRVIDADLIAVADLTRTLLPLLRESGGLVVVINSGSGLRVFPGSVAYTAAKFALRGLTDSLREEERGVVRVTAIHPGRIDTGMQRNLQAQAGRDYDPDDHMDPRDVAATVRLAVDLPADTVIEQLSVRPARLMR